MNETVNSTASSFSHPPNYTPDTIMLSMIVSTIFVSIGAFGNALVIYYISRKRMKLSNTLILTLALSDGLYCIAR